MIDRDFEQGLRVGLRRLVDEGASSALRASVHAIPDVVPATRRRLPTAGWRFPPMNRFAPLALATTAAVVAILLGVGLVLRGPNVGPSPIPGPSHSATPKVALFAFIKQLDAGRGALWVANVDGTGAHGLVPDLVGTQFAPAWSRDGNRLVFSWDRKLDGLGYPSGESRLYLTDAAGSAPELVDTGCVSTCWSDTDAAFSSDGTRLVFVRTLILPSTSTPPDPVTGKGVDTVESVVATIELSTGRVTELASTRIQVCCGTFENHQPRWSPDGTQIAFTQDVRYDVNGPEINGFAPPVPAPALYVVDADGQNLRRISSAGASNTSGDWSADGTLIVFTSWSHSDPVPNSGSTGYTFDQYLDIYTIRPDGTDLRRLTADQISQAASWTTGGRIGFIRIPAATAPLRQFWLMDADGGNPTQLSVVSPELQTAWPIVWPPER
jgi:Tol biopolymer transport system component